MHVRPADVKIRCYFAEILLLRSSFIPDIIPASCKIISKTQFNKNWIGLHVGGMDESRLREKTLISYQEPYKISNVLTTSDDRFPS